MRLRAVFLLGTMITGFATLVIGVMVFESMGLYLIGVILIVVAAGIGATQEDNR